MIQRKARESFQINLRRRSLPLFQKLISIIEKFCLMTQTDFLIHSSLFNTEFLIRIRLQRLLKPFLEDLCQAEQGYQI